MRHPRRAFAMLLACASLLPAPVGLTAEPDATRASLLRLTVDAETPRDPPADELSALVLLGPGTDEVDLEFEAVDDTPTTAPDGGSRRPPIRFLQGEGDARRGDDGRFHLNAVVKREGGDGLVKVDVLVLHDALRLYPGQTSIRYAVTGRVQGEEVFFASSRPVTAPSPRPDSAVPGEPPTLDGAEPTPTATPQAPAKVAPVPRAPAMIAASPRVTPSAFAVEGKRTIHFATNRNVLAWDGTLSQRFGDALGEGVRYGSCVVNIPTDEKRKPGLLDWPGPGATGDPARDFFITRDGGEFNAWLLDEAAFRAVVREADAERDALVYVHGFNTSFDFAVVRMAQVVEDMKFAGPPVVFSWPSRDAGSLPSPGDYSRDEHYADHSYGALARVFKTLAEERETRPSGRRGKIHVIAHSMGNRVAMRALSILDSLLPPDSKPMGRIVLAAPDVSTEEFARLLPAAQRRSERVSLYFNPSDQALWASFVIHGRERRAGNSAQFLAGLDNIDSSHVDTSLLGHGYWSSASVVLADLRLLIVHGWEPARRVPAILRAFTKPRPYWGFPVEAWYRRIPSPW